MTRRTELVLLAAILLLGAFLRFYRIADLPPGLYPDEAANGNNAAEALYTGEFKIFYPENNGREGLFINLQAVAIKLFGAEPWVLRMVSAIFGTLTVLGIYLLTRELFAPNPKPETLSPKQTQNSNGQNVKNGRRNFGFWILDLFRVSGLGLRVSRGEFIALLSSFFLATSYWHLNFSRIGFRAILVPFFLAFGMFLLLRALRTGSIPATVLAGLAAGLGFHTYIAFRFAPLVFAVPIAAALAGWRRGRKAQPCVPCVAALFLFVTFVVALPIGLYFLQHPQDFLGRGTQVSVFSADSPAREFAKSALLTAGMFNVRGDCNPRHNLSCAPQLFWPVGILFVVGLLLTIREAFRGAQKSQIPSTKPQTIPNDQNPNSQIPLGLGNWSLFGNWDLEIGISRHAAWLLLIWLGAMALPAVLTREGLPHALRAIGMIPAVMILAALGGSWLWQRLQGYLARAEMNPAYERYRRQIRRIKKELAMAAILFFLWLPLNAYRDYFVRFANAPETRHTFAADLLAQGRYLAALPDEVRKIVIVNLAGEDIRGVPAPAQTVMFATGTFNEEGRRLRNIAYVRNLAEVRVETKEQTLILPMNPADRVLVRELRLRHPDLHPAVAGDFVVFRN